MPRSVPWRSSPGSLSSHATLEALTERLPDLQEVFQIEALDKVLGSGSEELDAKVFARFTTLLRQARHRIVSHPALARAAPALAREVLEKALAESRRRWCASKR